MKITAVIRCSSAVSALLNYLPCLATPTTYLNGNGQVLGETLYHITELMTSTATNAKKNFQVSLGKIIQPGAISMQGSVLYRAFLFCFVLCAPNPQASLCHYNLTPYVGRSQISVWCPGPSDDLYIPDYLLQPHLWTNSAQYWPNSSDYVQAVLLCHTQAIANYMPL